ncbi:hypothetical protein M2192_000799 [Bradyrhizobium elkanii USDA 61]|nr:hypothetical protein [Bradyrhizobium elkanii]MCS3719434.1 hypothetical protein [Bradyrhizobium elkanii]MCS4003839.1 hypothetical protein [Bradyrhizobium elkanii USDA 61]BBB99002.1 hypothetical protein BE61_44430 [Bradyrhizobium elkanii USDA 61]
MTHDFRKDRVQRGMMMQGGAYPAVGPPSLEPQLEELKRRLQSVRECIDELRKGNAS